MRHLLACGAGAPWFECLFVSVNDTIKKDNLFSFLL